ncbi:MAG: PhzF family phenazine biosynthesis protein [Gammaproteobacteria bacterium]|nr:PhzF family phenazine biosynthesis protein [Gammaproteobacteria bacterium]
MKLLKISAFSDTGKGGNPAGVHLANEHPTTSEMQSIAADVGFSETAFAMPINDSWRVRYFSPETEVPFCGHATIALGAALASEQGAGLYSLQLNESSITVEGFVHSGRLSAALQSPPTFSRPVSTGVLSTALALFGYSQADLDPNLPAALVHGGANHLFIGLRSRKALAALSYSLPAGREFMLSNNLVTVVFAYAENNQLFHTRNPFASGGVYEDPATGAATAALSGYLRDIAWPHGGRIDIVQGEDMGSRSLICAEFDDIKGASIRISGAAHLLP